MLLKIKKCLIFVMVFCLTIINVLPSMTVSASAGSVTYYEKVTDSYGRFSGKFKVNDIWAFCANYDLTTPGKGTEIQSISESTNENLRKVLYYGWGGPASIVTDDSDGWMSTAQGVSLAYSGNAAANVYKAWYEDVIQKEAPPSSFKAYIAYPSDSSLQPLAYYVESPSGSLEIVKYSSDSDLTNDNPNYSLAGAVYGIYAEDGDYSSPEYTVTLSEWGDGWSGLPEGVKYGWGKIEGLSPGNYWVKEITAPKGFTLDENWYPSYSTPITVTSGETARVTVYDEPQLGSLEIYKSSTNPELTDENDCYSLEGAVYGVYFKDGDYKEPEYTIVTDKHGYGKIKNLPLGDYWVKEITAPKGYQLNDNWYPGYDTPITVKSGSVATVRVSDVPLNDPGAISITKMNPDSADFAHVPSLEGAEFTVKYYDGFYTKENLPEEETRKWVIQTKETKVNGETYYLTGLADQFKISGDDFYYVDGNPDPILPLGTISIEETKPAPGYTLNGGYLQVNGSSEKITEAYVAQIQNTNDGVSLVGGNKYLVGNYVLHGGIAVQKQDIETNSSNSQGMATLAGAKFEIRNGNSSTVKVAGKTFGPGEVITTLTTDENGYAATDKDFLPYGTYEVEEVEAPKGYLLKGTNLKQTVTVSEENTLTVASVTSDHIIRGGLSVQKKDADTRESIPQGLADLSGAKFSIKNANEQDVVVDGKAYSKGEVIEVLETDEKGYAQTSKNFLPYGIYEIEEVEAPKGYQLSGQNLKQKVTISKQGKVVSLEPIYEEVIRGGVSVQKMDADTNSTTTQGAAILSGAEIEIRSTNEQEIVVDGKTYSKGEVVTTLVTDKNGKASTKENLLPYGIYEVEEVKAPKGYLLSGRNLKQTVTVTKQNTLVNLNTEDTIFYDKVIRGDFELSKMEHYTGRVMADVKFKITSKTTGESHIIQTDKNGYYSSESSYKLHSEEGGLWFGLDEKGNSVSVNEERGALPYDTYLIEELRSDENEMTDLYTGEFVISENGQVVDLGRIENFERSIRTSAKDSETKDHFSKPDEKVTIIDTISYRGFVIGEEYTAEGILMNQETGEPIVDKDGEIITASVKFVPEKREGTVDVTFTFDASTLAGKALVVFETVYDADGMVQAEHKDLNDKEQTIYFPEVRTKLREKNSNSNMVYAGETTLVDTISYAGLEAGCEYKVSGILMDKETGKPVLVHGKEVRAETSFIAKASRGTVDVVFTFDAATLSGKTLVAFETLYRGQTEYATHADLNDMDQTIFIPQLQTTATDKSDGDKTLVSDGDVTIVDSVVYENLIAGESYLLKGVLMDKESEKPLLIDGQKVEVEKTFTAEKTDGTVNMEFTFDASGLEHCEVVVFEKLYQKSDVAKEETGEKSRIVAAHEDLEDRGQTVEFHKTPDTGDSANLVLYFGLGFVSLLAIYIFLRQRKAGR